MACDQGFLRPAGVLTMQVEVLGIDALGNGVGGVARPGDKPVTFIRGALPGEEVSCEIVSERASFRVGKLLEVLVPSAHRVDPPCPFFGDCGGCSLQHLACGEQLSWKRRWVEAALRRLGSCPSIREAIPSPLWLGYRNRVSFDITEDGRTGLHRHRGDPIPIGDCLLLGERGREMLEALGGIDLSFCRRLCVRSSCGSRSDALEISECTGPCGIRMPGVDVAVETSGGWKTPDGWSYAEILSGIRFSIPPAGFFQVNTAAAELLVMEVLRVARGADSVLDLYGGVGAFAIPLAAAGAQITSVDSNGVSSAAGAASATLAGLGGRVEFIAMDSRRFLQESADSARAWDLVIVDPPRGGLEARICRLLLRLAPPRIVYVSCDPQTLARDLKALEAAYDATEVIPFDLFPQTDSVETVTTLERRKGGTNP
jgi:23S rRNA (uracil1939-C5)-methyltransferase